MPDTASPPTASTDPGRPHAAAIPHDQLAAAEWRTGRTLGGRTLYARVGPDASKQDVLIGHMDTARIGERVVADHNAAIRLGDPDELTWQLHEAREGEAQANAIATAAEALAATVRAEAAELAEAAAAVLELLGAGNRDARPVKRLRTALAGWELPSETASSLQVAADAASDVGTGPAETRGTPENLAMLSRALAPWRCRVADREEGCRCIDDLSGTLAHAAALVEEECE